MTISLHFFGKHPSTVLDLGAMQPQAVIGLLGGQIPVLWQREESCCRTWARIAGLLILLIPRDGNVAGKDGVPEMSLRTKNGKLHGGLFLVVEDR